MSRQMTYMFKNTASLRLAAGTAFIFATADAASRRRKKMGHYLGQFLLVCLKFRPPYDSPQCQLWRHAGRRAGIHDFARVTAKKSWMPACAGMTARRRLCVNHCAGWYYSWSRGA